MYFSKRVMLILKVTIALMIAIILVNVYSLYSYKEYIVKITKTNNVKIEQIRYDFRLFSKIYLKHCEHNFHDTNNNVYINEITVELTPWGSINNIKFEDTNINLEKISDIQLLYSKFKYIGDQSHNFEFKNIAIYHNDLLTSQIESNKIPSILLKKLIISPDKIYIQDDNNQIIELNKKAIHLLKINQYDLLINMKNNFINQEYLINELLQNKIVWNDINLNIIKYIFHNCDSVDIKGDLNIEDKIIHLESNFLLNQLQIQNANIKFYENSDAIAEMMYKNAILNIILKKIEVGYQKYLSNFNNLIKSHIVLDKIFLNADLLPLKMIDLKNIQANLTISDDIIKIIQFKSYFHDRENNKKIGNLFFNGEFKLNTNKLKGKIYGECSDGEFLKQKFIDKSIIKNMKFSNNLIKFQSNISIDKNKNKFKEMILNFGNNSYINGDLSIFNTQSSFAEINLNFINPKDSILQDILSTIMNKFSNNNLVILDKNLSSINIDIKIKNMNFKSNNISLFHIIGEINNKSIRCDKLILQTAGCNLDGYGKISFHHQPEVNLILDCKIGKNTFINNAYKIYDELFYNKIVKMDLNINRISYSKLIDLQNIRAKFVSDDGFFKIEKMAFTRYNNDIVKTIYQVKGDIYTKLLNNEDIIFDLAFDIKNFHLNKPVFSKKLGLLEGLANIKGNFESRGSNIKKILLNAKINSIIETWNTKWCYFNIDSMINNLQNPEYIHVNLNKDFEYAFSHGNTKLKKSIGTFKMEKNMIITCDDLQAFSESSVITGKIYIDILSQWVKLDLDFEFKHKNEQYHFKFKGLGDDKKINKSFEINDDIQMLLRK